MDTTIYRELIISVWTMSDITSKFHEDEVVQDLKLSASPPNILEVLYPCGKKVNLGDELTPTEVKDIPTLKWPAEDGKLYAVLMVSSENQ